MNLFWLTLYMSSLYWLTAGICLLFTVHFFVMLSQDCKTPYKIMGTLMTGDFSFGAVC